MIIKREDYLFGIRHWVQFYNHRTPRLEVFRYVGVNKHMGIYYFQSVKEKTIIGRSFYQLNVNGFVPFCLDFRRIQDHLAAKESSPNANV